MTNNKALGDRTYTILEQLSERIIPSGSPDYPGTKEMDIPEIIIGRLKNLPAGLLILSVFLWWWEFSPFTFSLSFKRFSKMKEKHQIAYMESWEQSRLYIRRMTFICIKGLFMVFFYNDPRIWEKIGYREGCLAETDKQHGA